MPAQMLRESKGNTAANTKGFSSLLEAMRRGQLDTKQFNDGMIADIRSRYDGSEADMVPPYAPAYARHCVEYIASFLREQMSSVDIEQEIFRFIQLGVSIMPGKSVLALR